MQAVASELGLRCSFVRYDGEGFEGIFAGLAGGQWDAVASGATVTAQRQRLALFCRPYVRSGQSLVANSARHPKLRSVGHLVGCLLGVQRGNTSEPVARACWRKGSSVPSGSTPIHDILVALDDLEAGRLDAFMKLEPVTRWLIRDRPDLCQSSRRASPTSFWPSRFGSSNAALAEAIDGAQRGWRRSGAMVELGRRWSARRAGSTEVLE